MAARSVLLVPCLLAALAGSVRAEEPPAPEPQKLNIMSVGLASCLLGSSLKVEYERILGEHVSISLGAGGGYATLFFWGGAGGGLEARVHLFWGEGPNKFEIALGAGAVAGSIGGLWTDSDQPNYFAAPSPEFFLGWRYQPKSGLFARAGLEWSLLAGLPFGGAIGSMF